MAYYHELFQPMVWSVPREWEGETAFIVGGGPSVATQNLELLRGRRVIAINTSYLSVPFADYLIFGDVRWWRHHQAGLKTFAGRVVTCINVPSSAKNVLCLNKKPTAGLSTDPKFLMQRRTTYTAAINLAALLIGKGRIVLLGADGKRAPDGACHHHAPHPWPVRVGCWDEQRKELASLVQPLKAQGIEVLNASPGSAWDMWPVVSLQDVIDQEVK